MDKKVGSEKILLELIENCRSQNFAGYSKFDALNSPALEFLTFNNKYLRLIYIQLVKECPFHIRPLLGIKKSRNPKGIALFARAFLNLYETSGDKSYLDQAEELLNWLVENRYKHIERYCWGYNFIWQSQIFNLERYEPNAVVTVFISEAFIHAFRLTGKSAYLEVARSAAEFLLNDLAVLEENDHERAISYVKARAARIVLNTQVLTGAVFVKLYNITKKIEWLETARKQFNFTVNRRIKECTWNYSYPAERYHAVDNYHTGGILDALLEFYEETGDSVYSEVYWNGLDYYKNQLFMPSGAPLWMDNKRYPHDIHGSAQGIITFTKASYHRPEYIETARKIYQWTVENMYNPSRKEFIYRIGRYVRWNYSLMRWCNGWMSMAIAELIKRESSLENGVDYDRKRTSVRQ